MTSLRALIEQASGYAEALFDPKSILTPYYVAEAADGGLTVMALAAVGPRLDELRRSVELRLTLEGMRRWVFFSEAFLAEYAAGEAEQIEPVDHPERVEVILFDAVELKAERRLTATRQILDTGGAKRLMPLVVQRRLGAFRPSVAVRR